MNEIESIGERLRENIHEEEVSAVCNIHGQFQGIQRTFFGNVSGPYCPECEKIDKIQRDLMVTEREKKEHLKELALEEERRIYKLGQMNIELAFYESSLDNFKANTDEQKHNVDKVRALINGDIKKIVMTGKNGTGKTHLACASLHILGGKIMTMYEISTTIRASYTRDAGETELQIVDGYARLPLFVIDEIGRTKGGDVEANWLSYIIDKRHVRDLPTILISNKHTRKNCGQNGCADCLENYIGEDIMSRLCENGVLLKFSGDDWRKKRE